MLATFASWRGSQCFTIINHTNNIKLVATCTWFEQQQSKDVNYFIIKYYQPLDLNFLKLKVLKLHSTHMEESPSWAVIKWLAFKNRKTNTTYAKKPNEKNLNHVTFVDKQTNVGSLP
jgi:hypothetical protein